MLKMLNLKMYQIQGKKNNRSAGLATGRTVKEQITRWGTGNLSYCICITYKIVCQV